MTGKTLKGERVSKKGRGAVPKADFSAERELEETLKNAPDHKLNRKGFIDAGFNLASAISIAKGNAKKFGFEQRKAQGEVWLLK